MPRARPPQDWDQTVDVIVVGAGYAGCVAALTAHDAGANVLLMEKAEDPGGISICSVGGVRVADDADAALAYLRATNDGSIDEGVLGALAKGMTTIPDQIDELARLCGAEMGRRPSPGNYPFPGHETFSFVSVDAVPDFDPERAYPHVSGSPAGARLFRVLEAYLEQRGIEIQTSTAAERLFADEKGRQAYPFGRPSYNERGVKYSWSADNLREVEIGILGRAGDLGELARAIGVDEPVLSGEISRWNAACGTGRDGDFGRPPSSMAPAAEPPFYYAQVWSVVSNTQGGPVHDAEQRIVDVFGDPIGRLYAAGEMGSAFGFLYMSGGNLAECFFGGRIAGRNAAAEPAID